jgi:acyl carrier protein
MNLKNYDSAFYEAFSIEQSKEIKKLKYQDIEEWDSIGHMTLIANLEEKFKISLKTDDIVEFSSYEKGIQIIKKYIS